MAEDAKHYVHWEEVEKPTFTLPEVSPCYDPGEHLEVLHKEYEDLSKSGLADQEEKPPSETFQSEEFVQDLSKYEDLSSSMMADPNVEFYESGFAATVPTNYWKEVPSQSNMPPHHVRAGQVKALSPQEKPKPAPGHDNYLIKPGHWRVFEADPAFEDPDDEVVHYWDPSPLRGDESSQV